MKILDYFFAARPLLLMPVWSIYLVSLHFNRRSSGHFETHDLVVLTCLTLLFAGAFYINQVFDYESDLINKKCGFLQKGLISQRAMMVSYLVVSLLALSAGPLSSQFMAIVFLQLMILGYAYSAPPIRLKDRPIGGLLANGYAHGFLVAISVEFELSWHDIGTLDWHNPLYFVLTVGATYILTTIPDLDGDRSTGKRTVTVALGRNVALTAALVMMLSATFVAYRSEVAILFYLAAFASFVVGAAMFIRTPASVLMAAKLPLLLLTLLAGYWYPVYFFFVVALIIVTRIYYMRRFRIIYPKLA